MNRCLCCGKPLKNLTVGSNEYLFGWHTNCIKKFFGTSRMPDIDFSEEMFEMIATESINKGYTVTGVQKKLSLHLSTEKEPRLTLVNYPTGYILKPQTAEYKCLPEAEYLAMQMAVATGIKTVPFALLKHRTPDGDFAYITKRIDRVKSDNGIGMLAMEDFCQLDGRITMDKYRGSYERCGKVILNYSSQKMLDLTELFLRIVFSFAIGNSDMHLKNFSLIETYESSSEYVLSSAYDLLPVNIIIPEDLEQLALTINGKKRNIRKKDFYVFADTLGITEKATEKLINKVVSMKAKYITMCKDSFLPDDMQEALINLITERIAILS